MQYDQKICLVSFEKQPFFHFRAHELPAKLLDYFLRSNKSNINQIVTSLFKKRPMSVTSCFIHVCDMTHSYV